MKESIRKILKEDREEMFFNMILNYIHENPNVSINYLVGQFGLTEVHIERFINEGLSKLRRSIGVVYNTDDYDGSFGTYSFKFSVYYHSEYSPHYNEISIDIEFHNEGEMTMLDNGNEYTMEEAINNEDYGWEVRFEVTDVIVEILQQEIPELSLLDIHVDNYVFYEG